MHFKNISFFFLLLLFCVKVVIVINIVISSACHHVCIEKLLKMYLRFILSHWAVAGKVLWQKMVKSLYNWVIHLLTQPQVANKKKILSGRWQKAGHKASYQEEEIKQGKKILFTMFYNWWFPKLIINSPRFQFLNFTNEPNFLLSNFDMKRDRKAFCWQDFSYEIELICSWHYRKL